MLARRFVAVFVVIGIIGFAPAAWAKSSADRKKSFLDRLDDRLDDLGRAIFGEIIPLEKSKTTTKTPTPPKPDSRASSRKTPSWDSLNDDVTPPRAGSILSGTVQRSSVGEKSVDGKPEFTPEDMPPAVPRKEDVVARPVVRRPPADASPRGEVDSSKPAIHPLHQRLSGFRQSVFGDDAKSDLHPLSTFQPERTSAAAVVKSPKVLVSESKPEPKPGMAYVAERPAIAQRATTKAPAAEPAFTVVADALAATSPKGSSGVLFARKGPILSVETVGPRTINVGKESTYEVHIVNSGEVAAEDLVVFVSLPEWAEVAGTQASAGAAQTAAANQATGAVQWNVGSLGAKGRERLSIQIVPRQSRQFDLAVRWQYKPIASQAVIEVREPKLLLQLQGPREVLYGKKELYSLKLANTGNGDAEGVVVTLMPMGTGENVPASHKVGLLAAGEEKVLDVELTARQAGHLTIQAEARAEGGAHAELTEKVLVRRAGLKLELDGPKMQFVGAMATYAVRVRNPGTAVARNVNLSIALPAGAKYLSGIEGARLDASSNKLEWTVEALSPGVEQSFTLKCRLEAAGMNRLRLSAVADNDVAASAETVARVEAVANLVMDVKDPAGPTPVGAETVYEVRLRNRGTKEAQGVEVFGYFSHGIEPTAAEGAPNRLGSGQVVFRPIASLGPGEEVVLKIRARAEVAGNHVFRTEVHCKPLDVRLIREATSLYYADSTAARQTVATSDTRSNSN